MIQIRPWQVGFISHGTLTDVTGSADSSLALSFLLLLTSTSLTAPSVLPPTLFPQSVYFSPPPLLPSLKHITACLDDCNSLQTRLPTANLAPVNLFSTQLSE